MKLARVYSGEFSWGGSLFLKLAFLGLGVGFVYWAGWPQPSIPPVSVPSTRQSGILSADTIHSGPAGLAPVAVGVAPLPVNEARHDPNLTLTRRNDPRTVWTNQSALII